VNGRPTSGRISVGTHYRVWWFWLPIIVGGLAGLLGVVLLPIAPVSGGIVCIGALLCLVMAAGAGAYIARGRRWVELSEDSIRLSARNVEVVIADEQVTDLAINRQPHHGAGKLLAETRQLLLWIESESGPQRIRLSSRLAPGGLDPLQPLINRLCHRLGEEAARKLAARESIDGDGWSLDATRLHMETRRQSTTLPVTEISAVEVIGSEVRIWQSLNPYSVARVPISGRNGWLLDKLLKQRLQGRRTSRPDRKYDNEAPLVPESPASFSALGRILFERTPGSGPTILFGVMGLLLGVVGAIVLWSAIQSRDPVVSAGGGLLILLSGLCFFGGIRLRRVRFRCYERGIERISMTSRRVLPFEEIDVFSFECRRNQSHGRYTGTTYTLVFADRSREQGRGIFYSTTVRNLDEELDDLRERVSQVIARRMAQTFAAHHSVQWTPEVWFRRDSLEYIRRKRLFVPTRVLVIPYDTITDFELRDGLLHIWTSYQDRAVLSLSSSTPNLYPGLIVLEGVARAWRQRARVAAS
jgi:hypothetical protein